MVTREQVLKVLFLFFLANFSFAIIFLPLHYVNLSQSEEEKLFDYSRLRETLVAHDKSHYVGSQFPLNCNEKLVLKHLMIEKYEDVDHYQFDPSENFLNSSKRISNSALYNIVRRMPKGGLLHVHDLTICKVDTLLALSYRDYLWTCSDENGDFKKLRFSKTIPNNQTNCVWLLLQNLRRVNGKGVVDQKLKESFLLNATKDVSWSSIRNTISFISGMVTYKQVYAQYHMRALEELRSDGVFYVELRSELPLLYNLDGVSGTIYDTAAILADVVTEFKQWFPDFFGVKLIYAPNRNVNDTTIDSYFEHAIKLQELHPNFFIGIDLVSQDSAGRTIKELIPKLLPFKHLLKFYMHVAETNWIGSDYDEDLYDILLMENQRIVNSFSLINHPQVMQNVKLNEIPVEVCPISNQMLKLVTNFRNHPLSH
ncbi:adenosine deaminase 2-A-like, partial [Teleopsis dalmanni]|uniref:adenosine deaminase 2-A-like n=1 Tax=Teleopsis dalmanni TaxID=139649 RepID=UPI0018CD369D